MTNINEIVRKEIEEDFDYILPARLLDVALKVKAKMAQKGVRTSDLATRLNVSDANISRWLRGDQNLSLKTMLQLADALQEPFVLEFGSRTAAIDAQEVTEVEAIADALVGSNHPRLWTLHKQDGSVRAVNLDSYRLADEVDGDWFSSGEPIARMCK